MLSWSNQNGWSRKASNTQKRSSHDNSNDIPNSSLLQATINDEASQPQQESTLDHNWYSYHMGEK